MTREEIESKIIAFMVENFELRPDAVSVTSKFEDDLGLDSIDAVELALHLGEMTNSEIQEDTLRKIVTVGDVVDLVEKIQAQPQAAD